MFRVNDRYFICEDGHITVGNTKKTKCECKGSEINYVKGKRKGQWLTEEKDIGLCGKKIVSEHDIPERLQLGTVWDSQDMHAFLIGQKLDAGFMIALQEEVGKLWERLK